MAKKTKNLHDRMNAWAKDHIFDMLFIFAVILVIMQYAGVLIPHVHVWMTLLVEGEQSIEVWGMKHPLLVAAIPFILQYAFPPKGKA